MAFPPTSSTAIRRKAILRIEEKVDQANGSTHLNHFVVHAVEDEAEELLGVLLAPLDGEHVGPQCLQHPQDDGRLESVVPRDFRHVVLLVPVSWHKLAVWKLTVVRHELDPRMRHVSNKESALEGGDPCDLHCISDWSLCVTFVCQWHLRNRFHEMVEGRARDERLQDGVDVAVVRLVEQTSRQKADAVAFDLVF